MARTAIQPPSLRDPRPRFTTAWKVDNTIYVAGQTASEAQGVAGRGAIRVQTRPPHERIKNIHSLRHRHAVPRGLQRGPPGVLVG